MCLEQFSTKAVVLGLKNNMKTKHLFWILPLLALLVIAAVQVTPGQKTSDYPHTNQEIGRAHV